MDCYIRLPFCSALYARNAQYVRGPSSVHDPRNVSSIDSKALLHFTGLLAVMRVSHLVSA